MDGILLVDKTAGTTSAGVVRVVKARLREPKVGHLGTLDPFATGLLPLCLGEGSKIVPYLNQEDKAYEGTIRLGSSTDTLDSTGATVAEAPVPPLDADALDRIALRFTGEIDQVPPMYSALKRGGVPLYRLARQGVTVERQARRIRIHSFELTPARRDAISFRVRCSKGTYVRCLAADVAAALGSLGHLESLRRTAFGPFDVASARTVDALTTEDLPLVSPRDALGGLRELPIDPRTEERIRRGQQAALAALPPPGNPSEVVKLVSETGALAALAGSDDSVHWRLLRVLARR